jgi:hypothetical protein
MRLCSYIVKSDTGLAPNPFWGYCTLALCTPNHMGIWLEAGDWVIGVTRKDRGNRLIYAMEVDERIHFNDYFNDPRFKRKKPNVDGTWRQRCGDNQYYLDESGKWCSLLSYHHDTYDQQLQDTKRPYAFIGRKFYYFGENAVDLPKQFEPLIQKRHGVKCNHDEKLVQCLIKWLGDGFEFGRHGEPMDRETVSIN